VDEQLFFKVVQKQSGTRAHDRISWHQLWMRKALVNVLIDDVGLVQDQIALYQDRNLPVRVHHGDVFGLVVEINVADFEIHALLKQHKPAAVRKGTSGAGVEDHHGEYPS